MSDLDKKHEVVKSGMVVMRKVFRTIDAKVSRPLKNLIWTPTQFEVWTCLMLEDV